MKVVASMCTMLVPILLIMLKAGVHFGHGQPLVLIK